MQWYCLCEGEKKHLEISVEVRDNHNSFSSHVSEKGQAGESKHIGKDLRNRRRLI